MFSRLTLERQQVWLSVAGILAGLALGTQVPSVGPLFDTLLWPILGTLFYTTFVQVPLLHLRDAFRDARFVVALLLGNFVLIPLLAWGLVLLLPDDSALRLGVLLVLPFALSLPAGWEATVVVIVLQTLVELFAMVFYLWWIPRYLFRA